MKLKIHVRLLWTDSGVFVEFQRRRPSGGGAMRPRSGPYGREHANPEKIENRTFRCTLNVPNSRTFPQDNLRKERQFPI